MLVIMKGVTKNVYLLKEKQKNLIFYLIWINVLRKLILTWNG